jgi:beta-phosphoglucomutase-like phosphatase (HAD superfamily)
MSGADSLTVILDVDGTLVDTNYQHALAWQHAGVDDTARKRRGDPAPRRP